MYTGERFIAIYHVSAKDKEEAQVRAWDICLEQTIEFPEDLVWKEEIREHVFGRIASLEEVDFGRFQAVVEFSVEVAGRELTQLLNVLFGNISIKPGIRLMKIQLPDSLSSLYRGPRFGCEGLREKLNVPEGPLLSTAVKPMGLTAEELAELAYRFALGGMDMIKDDHGLSDQEFCPFEERISRCAEAVRRANQETGRNCLYMPNITSPFHEFAARCKFAKDAGVGGFVISPGLSGLDAMRWVADNDELNLPILSHPAMQGSLTVHNSAGMSHGVLYGQINRLAGADACIFPNYGGRFAFMPQECRDIVDATQVPMGAIKPIFPVPAGGMKLQRVPELLEFYGNHVILLIGGDLHRHGPDLSENCKKFARLVGR